jgi:hypothetical protein
MEKNFDEISEQLVVTVKGTLESFDKEILNRNGKDVERINYAIKCDPNDFGKFNYFMIEAYGKQVEWLEKESEKKGFVIGKKVLVESYVSSNYYNKGGNDYGFLKLSHKSIIYCGDGVNGISENDLAGKDDDLPF